MHTASFNSGRQFEQCVSVVRQAGMEILSLLDVHTAEVKDLRWFQEQLEQARLNLGGWANVAQRLNLNDAQLSDFILQLHRVRQVIPVYERGQAINQDQMIAVLRFAAAQEFIRQRQPLLTFASVSGADGKVYQERAQRQMRALTLTMKGLINQAYPDQSGLNNFLERQFGADKVRHWLANSDPGDTLSGMQFSELALIIVDKKTFLRYYSSIFNMASTLTFLAERQVTLHTFLEDCRVMRNAILERRPLTAIEIALLDNYLQQITEPIQRAFKLGHTEIDPAAFMAIDSNELHRFWELARHKDHLLGGDLLPIRENIEPPQKRSTHNQQEHKELISTALWSTVGITIMVVSFAVLCMFSDATPEEPVIQAQEVHLPEPNHKVLTPRDKLAEEGIHWDTGNLRSAIDRNDVDVTRLFLQGGMNWQLAWTDHAQSFHHEEVLELLLAHRRQMEEHKPCHRFIASLSHAMARGEPLMPIQKSYLHAFCSVPEEIAHQRSSVSQAKKRALAKPDAQNKKWLTIQSAIYSAID
ncbi:MAG TPA: STY4199 family HEPN domain-containing protein [Scandinavium sp.]|jgi:hypothetical protein|uniref:STY4199 family HEPN domain-containing protein n=1 Tax=Scandinavium sp. TaxID=2830653 RepID=UPI002E308E3D|nr:STY4199 family HEPN domain-containing protein [Scandinavium sp.]HEX4503461.1 STY4199 family HEPN domain-containing protein [Scandinavium sp.]